MFSPVVADNATTKSFPLVLFCLIIKKQASQVNLQEEEEEEGEDEEGIEENDSSMFENDSIKAETKFVGKKDNFVF